MLNNNLEILVLKLVKSSRSLFILTVIFFSLSTSHAQNHNNNCKQAELLIKALSKYHYSPPELTDHWSEQIFNKFFKLLDPYGLFFTEEDFKTLNSYRFKAKEIISDPTCIFLNQVTKLYEKRLKYADTLISLILQKPIDLFVKDSITLSLNDKTTYSANNKSLEKRWEKWLKYQILLQLFSSTNENEDPFVKETRQLLLKEQDVLNTVKIKEKKRLKYLLRNYRGLDNYVSTIFYNSIALCYDPHSAYFSFSDKQDFLSSLSKETYSFGIGIEENLNGEVQISRLKPGGPAWKSGKLHKGDILVQLKWEGQKPVSLSNLSIEEVGEIIKSSSSGSLEFTIKKPGGQLSTFRLIKEKMESDENLITSHILKGEKKIGYIALPDFYTETENQNGLGCANDVAKEIIKLKKDNIDGLILDLRSNGGGSIAEALDLAGIFIDEGPLVIVRYRNSKPMVLKDMNRGTVYDGPLLILVNGQSASASEILAAVLQDYHRAIIVGSTTFGKATGQNIFPLDTTFSSDPYNSDNNTQFGFAKITVSKLYRITGSSWQLSGVIPDIALPNMLNNIEYSEKSDSSALPSDLISKKVYYNLLPALPVKELNQKSCARILKNKRFQQITSLNNSFANNIIKGKTISLNIDSFRKDEKEIYSYFQSMDSLPKLLSQIFSVGNNNYNTQIINIDPDKKDYDELLIKNIQEDIYIEEAFKIIDDFINLTVKKK